MNLRPSGYEPDELPGCSTPRHMFFASGMALPSHEARSRLLAFFLRGLSSFHADYRSPSGLRQGRLAVANVFAEAKRERRRLRLKQQNRLLGGLVVFQNHEDVLLFCRSGGDLLFRALRRSTIGTKAFHFRVRDGTGWDNLVITTRSTKE